MVDQAESLNKVELHRERQQLQRVYTQEAKETLKQVDGKQYSTVTMMEAEQDVENLVLG